MSAGDGRNSFLCGVCEGFYGRPWTARQRRELFRRMQGTPTLRHYMYAPKDDVKHRASWRQRYSVEEAETLQALIQSATNENVIFIYALSPGIDIVYSSNKDRAALHSKFDQVRSMGCNAFAILFDDIESAMCDADRNAFGSFAAAQVAVANDCFETLGGGLFLFCPTEIRYSRRSSPAGPPVSSAAAAVSSAMMSLPGATSSAVCTATSNTAAVAGQAAIAGGTVSVNSQSSGSACANVLSLHEATVATEGVLPAFVPESIADSVTNPANAPPPLVERQLSEMMPPVEGSYRDQSPNLAAAENAPSVTSNTSQIAASTLDGFNSLTCDFAPPGNATMAVARAVQEASDMQQQNVASDGLSPAPEPMDVVAAAVAALPPPEPKGVGGSAAVRPACLYAAQSMESVSMMAVDGSGQGADLGARAQEQQQGAAPVQPLAVQLGQESAVHPMDDNHSPSAGTNMECDTDSKQDKMLVEAAQCDTRPSPLETVVQRVWLSRRLSHLLVDMFYLPFEHGRRGEYFIDEFRWLVANAPKAEDVVAEKRAGHSVVLQTCENRPSLWLASHTPLKQSNSCNNGVDKSDGNAGGEDSQSYGSDEEVGQLPNDHLDVEPWIWKGGLTAELHGFYRARDCPQGGKFVTAEAGGGGGDLADLYALSLLTQELGGEVRLTGKENNAELRQFVGDSTIGSYLHHAPEFVFLIDEMAVEPSDSMQAGADDPAAPLANWRCRPVGFVCAAPDVTSFRAACDDFGVKLRRRYGGLWRGKEHLRDGDVLQHTLNTVFPSSNVSKLWPLWVARCSAAAVGRTAVGTLRLLPAYVESAASKIALAVLMASLKTNGSQQLQMQCQSGDSSLCEMYGRYGFAPIASAGGVRAAEAELGHQVGAGHEQQANSDYALVAYGREL